MRALILAAGFGTRLGALSDERPKPLLPLCDIPAIRYGLALLEAHGFTEVMVNLHHRGELIEEELGRGTARLRVHYAPEAEILGTGGAIRNVGDWLTDGGRQRFLVMNGKLVIDLDLAELRRSDETKERAATLCLRAVPDADRWGAVETSGSEVLRIIGRGAAGVAEKKWMFTGVHIVSPAIVERLPLGPSCIIRQGYIPALESGLHLGFYACDGYFEEHSTPARYLAGNRALLDGTAALRHPPGALVGCDATATREAGVTLVPPFRVGAGAHLGAGARIGPYAVVGRGARIEAGASVEDTVVWPGAVAKGALAHAIVTDRGVFLVEPDGAGGSLKPQAKPPG